MSKSFFISILLAFSTLAVFADHEIKIGQNYPNPAKEKTFIKVEFEAPEATLVLSNILGESLQTLKVYHSGTYELDVSNVPDGVYFYTLDSNGHKITKRLTVKK